VPSKMMAFQAFSLHQCLFTVCACVKLTGTAGPSVPTSVRQEDRTGVCGLEVLNYKAGEEVSRS